MTANITSVIQKLLLAFLVFAGLYYAKVFLMPLFIGGILATLFLPFCNWMEKKKINKAAAVLVSLLSLLSIVAFVFTILSYKIYDFLDDFAMIKREALSAFDKIQMYVYDHLNLSFKEQIQILKKEQPSYGNIMQMVFASLTSLLTNFILVLVYFIFLLYYRFHIKVFFLKQTVVAQQEQMEHLIDSAANISQQYLVGVFKMIGILWIMYGIGFSIIGVKNALFFAVLCGLLEIIPYIGNITGTLLTLVVAATQGANLTLLGGIVFVYGTVQLIQGWLLEPLILGPQVKINPLFTIISLVLGELLWGIPGLILAIPAIAMIKIVCDHIEALKPYGFLIGEIEVERKALRFIKEIKVSNQQSN
jgi:predicted PurR-regulated permease PerM